ncbi:MAG: DUF4349 domain-containing protein [Ferruginibacter sp.]
MKFNLFTACILFVFFISCNRSKFTDQTKALSDASGIITTTDAEQAPAQAKGKKQFQPIPVNSQQSDDSVTLLQTPVVNPDWDKKIIKTATLRVEVDNFKTYGINLRTAVKQFGGYISAEEQNLADDRSESVVSLKIPVVQFESFVNQLSVGNVKVSERKISSEDVTGEVVDTRSRLEAKKQMRIKYLEFLKQSKNMEEVLQVQAEINSIQEEIESASARVQSLSHSAAYSTVNLTYFQPLPGYKPTDGSPSFFKRVIAAFGSGGHMIGDFFVGLITIWPLLLIIAGLYIGYRKMRPTTAVTRIQ